MAETKRDYYDTLGLSKSANDDEIKKAYRKLAKQYHPDLNPGDKVSEAKFKEINEANDVLTDPQKRRKYDQFGHAGVDPNYGGGGGGFGGGFPGGFSGGSFNVGDGIDLGDIFDSIFGGGGRASSNVGPKRGSDIAINLDVSFMEACKGVTEDVEVSVMEGCPTCNGSGARPGTIAATCTQCGGMGRVRVKQRSFLGDMTTEQTCSKCQGKGKVIESPCVTCNGAGRVHKKKTVRVGVPAGIDDGQTLVIRDEGNAGTSGGAKGNLNVRISVRRDPVFERRGSDIYIEVPVTYSEAALGAEIEVPTIDGKQTLIVPEGTQPNTVFRMKDRGVQRLQRESRGDQYVKASIEVPKHLNAQQKELIKQLQESLGERNYEKKTSFTEKLRKFGGDIKRGFTGI
ncbi:MAG: molecular chaperone DnaJ [Oscillospiraceae bacterium]|jgi:molecular chaperone DnaJ|nr:molecular chaperone DnaJ [Oscillospiraceae bacterium]